MMEKLTSKQLRYFITHDYVRRVLIGKYFTTPLPINMLARLQGVASKINVERDWKLDPQACTFNSALNLAADNDPTKFTAFLLVYFRKDASDYFKEKGHADCTITEMAKNHNVDPSTVSRWGYNVATHCYNQSIKLLQAERAGIDK